MQVSDLLREYDRAEREQVVYPDRVRQATAHVVRHLPPAATSGFRDGFISYSRLDERSADMAIEEQIAFFESHSLDFEWKVYAHDTPVDLRQRLVARGFEMEDPEAIMALVLADAPSSLLAPVTHDVRRLTDPDQLDLVMAVQRTVWAKELNSLAGYLRDAMISTPDLLTVYLAYAGDAPAAAAWLYYDGQSPFASLWGGSTLPAYRKQGLYTALLAQRVQEARQKGARFLTIDASPMSRPIVERFGFLHLTTAYAGNWKRKG